MFLRCFLTFAKVQPNVSYKKRGITARYNRESLTNDKSLNQ